ncbi:MAG: YggT family protein [Actinomycetes bacterium]
MFSIGRILAALVQLFLLALFGRLILDYIRMFSRNWRPRGIVLAIVELLFAVTDPPLKFVRKFVPPLRLGAVNLDLSFIVVFFAVQLLSRVIALIP